MLTLLDLATDVVLIRKFLGHRAGMIALVVVIVFLLWILARANKENHRAYYNCRKYWEEGGPDRERRDERNGRK